MLSSISSFTAAALAIVQSVTAAPSQLQPSDLSVRTPIEKRDPCNQQGATYVLYKEYDQSDCPAKNPSNPNDCFPLFFPHRSIDRIFCQTSVVFSYGQEEILLGHTCRSGQDCSITSTVTKSTTHTFTINGNAGGPIGFTSYLSSFQLGAS